MTETELAVIAAAVDLVTYWHEHGDRRTAAILRAGVPKRRDVQRWADQIDGPRLIDLEDKLADAVHTYGQTDGA